MFDSRMLSCEEAQTRLADYSVGALEAGDREAVERHLERCAACAKELKALDGSMALVEAVESVEPPVGMWDAVYAQITASEPSRPTPLAGRLRSMFTPPRRALAAGFAVLALLAMMTFQRMQTPVPPVVADGSTSEYVQGHAIFASDDAFADRVGLASITGASMVGEEPQSQ